MARPITQLTDTFKIFRDNVNTISNNVGDPINLTTTQDSDLVTAVNELDSDLHGSGGGSVASSLNAVSYASSAINSGLVGAFNAVDAFIGGDSSVLPTTATTLVYAIKEIDEDIHGVGGGNAVTDLDTEAGNLVDAINEIESVFDASQTQIVSNDDFSITVMTGDLSMVASGDATLDVEGGLTLSTGSQISLQKNNVQYGSLLDSADHLVLKTGTGLIPALKFDSANAYMLNTLFTDSALDTTAKSVAGGINELDSRVTTLEDSVGSGGLDTVAQTLVGGINELDSEMGELTDLDPYFDDADATIVTALNTLSADVLQLFDSSGTLDERIGALSNLSSFFDSDAGGTASIVAALNYMAGRVIDIYDENGTLLNT